jgi:hypothetical protein
LAKYVALLACCLLLGCYSFRGQIAGDIKTLAIPTFTNESTEFGLSETVTDELIRGFQKDGTLRIVPDSQADAILVGTLVDAKDEPYTARSGTEITVEEYRFSMMCRMELVIRETGEVKWTQTFPAWAIYSFGGDLSNRDLAVTEATTKLVEDLLNKIVGSW